MTEHKDADRKGRHPGVENRSIAARLNAVDLALASQELELESTRFLQELLPVFDGIRLHCHGLDRMSADEIVQKAEAISILSDLTEQALQSIGLVRLGQVGDVVDPACHEVVETRAVDDVPRGTVVEILECGWEHDDRTLRCARVVASVPSSESISE